MAKQPVQPVNENQPVHSVRHRSLKASVWRNETATGPMYKVLLVRSYQENNEWHDTHSLRIRRFDERGETPVRRTQLHHRAASKGREFLKASRPIRSEAAVLKSSFQRARPSVWLFLFARLATIFE
jgi:hypothetical protein